MSMSAILLIVTLAFGVADELLSRGKSLAGWGVVLLAIVGLGLVK